MPAVQAAAREALKFWNGDAPFDKEWGTKSQKYLKRGSGHPHLAKEEGNLDFTRALNKRKSLKEFVDGKRKDKAPMDVLIFYGKGERYIRN